MFRITRAKSRKSVFGGSKMRGFVSFTKKEFYEYIRTYKVFISAIFFLLLGFLNPITAKYMPELMKEFMPEGLNITLPEPTIFDSWLQFFKNVPQLGLVAIVIIFNGIMANELSKGTLTNMLTKGLSRKIVILSKFTAASILWSFSYFLSFFVTLGYSRIFWEQITMPNLIFSVTCVWIFGLMLISCLILGGILFQSTYGGLLFVGLIFILSYAISLFKIIANFSPIKLVTNNTGLLAEEIAVSDMTSSVAMTLVLTAVLLAISIFTFNKTKI